MQVESSSSSSSSSFASLGNNAQLDYSDIFNTDLFASTSATPSLLAPSGSPSSLQSSPTPSTPYDSFSEPSMFTAASGDSSDFFNFLDSGATNTLGPSPEDLMSKPSSASSDPFGLSGFDFSNALTSINTSQLQQQLPSPTGTIDPSLMGTPSTGSFDDFDMADSVSSSTSAKDDPKLTVTIPAVKAGGHGKGARKGTVQGGGVTKPRASATRKASATVVAPAPPVTSSSAEPGSPGDNDQFDDDLPADWRPSPEALAKMSSKEKRQLRNKISARNFRVRRKEYISTLEMDIAERDKLLSAIRSELGSSQSENSALRQEISALKRALLSGRPPSPSLISKSEALEGLEVLNLPPPAPLPETSAAQRLSQSAVASTSSASTQPITPPTSPLLKPNLSKDLPSSSSSASSSKAFWGGVNLGMGGGITPVHRMVLPEVDLERAFHSQRPNSNGEENINPLMQNNHIHSLAPTKKDSATAGFEQFSDSNMFNFKNMDAYRMQLWTQMAMRNQQQQQQQQSLNLGKSSPALSGLAGSIRPHYFMGGSSSSSSGSGSNKAGLLTPPASPLLLGKKSLASSTSSSSSSYLSSPPSSSSYPKPEEVFVAQLASQTLMKRLGSAFWDAFKGKAGEDGVQKVLDGRAVFRIVDVVDDEVEQQQQLKKKIVMQKPKPMMVAATPSMRSGLRRVGGGAGAATGATRAGAGAPDGGVSEKSCVCDLLEESMRSLSLVAKK